MALARARGRRIRCSGDLAWRRSGGVPSLTRTRGARPTFEEVRRRASHLPRTVLARLRSAGDPPRRVWEDPDALGYVLGADPLLEILPAREWRALEQRALAAVRG